MSKYFYKRVKIRVEPESGIYFVSKDGTKIDTDDCTFAALIPPVASHNKQPFFFFKFQNSLLCTKSEINYLTQQGAQSYINVEASEFTLLRKVEDKDITWIEFKDLEYYTSYSDIATCADSAAALGALQDPLCGE